MPLDLYHFHGSPPCRAVLLTAKLLGIEFNLKSVALEAGEHLKPEFLKINPQHTVPALVDNGTILIESRAIMAYLVSQYKKNNSLYPEDPRKRAMIFQRILFDQATLFSRFEDYYYVPVFTNTDYVPAKKTLLEEAVKLLDTFLEKSEYVAGDTLTIADITIYVSVTTLEACKFDVSGYKNVARWLAKVKGTLGDNENDKSQIEAFRKWYESVAKK